MSVKVTGFGNLNRKLQSLQAAMTDDVMRQALRDGAEVVAAEARRLAPVRSGSLRDSIEVTDDRDARLYGRIGGGDVSVYVGPVGSTEDGDVFYAKFVEFGTVNHRPQPFLRPAIEGKQAEAGLVTIQSLEQAIIKAIK